MHTPTAPSQHDSNEHAEPVEYERRFLAPDAHPDPTAPRTLLIQGYLHHQDGRTIRVRVAADPAPADVTGTAQELLSRYAEAFTHGYLTAKAPLAYAARYEIETAMPPTIAAAFLTGATHMIAKVRTDLGDGWFLDQFADACTGLVIAELELPHPVDNEPVPTWVAREITDDPAYYNSSLAQYPRTS